MEFTAPFDSTGKGIRLSENEFIQDGVYLRYYNINDIKIMLKDFNILCFASEYKSDPHHGYIRGERHQHHSYFALARKL